jgi:hypothetical protein
MTKLRRVLYLRYGAHVRRYTEVRIRHTIVTQGLL